MKRLTALISLAVLSVAFTVSATAQSPITDEANEHHAEKAQKEREKQIKKAAKQQEKARKKSEKARRKAIERAQQQSNH